MLTRLKFLSFHSALFGNSWFHFWWVSSCCSLFRSKIVFWSNLKMKFFWNEENVYKKRHHLFPFFLNWVVTRKVLLVMIPITFKRILVNLKNENLWDWGKYVWKETFFHSFSTGLYLKPASSMLVPAALHCTAYNGKLALHRMESLPNWLLSSLYQYHIS